MNYKSLLKSRKLRIKILGLLDFVPDKMMVSLQYRIKTGRKLNWKHLQRYSEKLQWYKIYYRDAEMARCADKYEVRSYVAEMGYDNILTPIFGIYDDFDSIDFDQLPDKFVIKDTLGGGGNSVIICEAKSKLDLESLKEEVGSWIKSKSRKHPGREWVYDREKNRILIEKYIESKPEAGGLIDYKFFCFNGKVKYVYGIADRNLGNGAGLAIYSRNFERLPYLRADEHKLERELSKPTNYEAMIQCAEKLSERFPHARIDLYDQNEEIRFGEITFFDGSGYMTFEPDEFDYILGEQFEILSQMKGFKR